MERFVLLKLKVNGVKGIEKELEFDFSNRLLNLSFDNSNSHVKAIYGSNGAGKTAVIYAMKMFRQLILGKNFLSLANFDGTFKKIINQNTNYFFIEVTFAQIDEESKLKNIYIQSFSIEKKKEDPSYFISHESLKKQNGMNLSRKNKTKLIYEIDNDILVLNCDEKDKDRISSCCVNLLGNTPFFQIIASNLGKLCGHIESKNFFEGLYSLYLFTLHTTIILNEQRHFLIQSTNLLESFVKILKIKKEEEYLSDIFLLTSDNDDLVFTDSIQEYEKKIDGVIKFLKVFKTDLKTIEIERKIDGEYYHCRNILVYKDGRKIDRQYESTGVKKLIGYYDAFCRLEQGDIVFIDEFDANIHDVLLTKLLEYITYYTEGQFIFTTHNLNPMHVLRKQKHSIDFISNDGCVISWTSSGNYDPASLYSKGLIDNSPFDMSANDFIGVFENESM